MQTGEGSVDEIEGRKRGLELQGMGGGLVGGHGVREDNPFDLIPIIEFVMMEHKG